MGSKKKYLGLLGAIVSGLFAVGGNDSSGGTGPKTAVIAAGNGEVGPKITIIHSDGLDAGGTGTEPTC